MKTSDRGIAALVAHEGIVPAPYLDSVGVWTYGVGHTAAAGAPNPASMPRGMPRDIDSALRDVFSLFRKDLANYEAAVARAVRVPVAQHEFDALVSFHYNTGAIAKASLTAALNRGDRKEAAALFLNWKKPASIIPRREDEQRLFASGQYPPRRAAVWPVSATGKVTWKPERTLSADQIISYMRPAGQPRPAPKPTYPNPATHPVPSVATIPVMLIGAGLVAAFVLFKVFGG